MIGMPTAALAASAPNGIGTLAAEYSPLKAAYDAWREADDRATEIGMAVDLAKPPRDRVQMTYPTPDMLVSGHEPIFWPLYQETIAKVRQQLKHSFLPRTPERLAAVSARLAGLETRLAAYEAECRAVAERHGLPEAEQRRRETKAMLLAALATAVGVMEDETVDMCDALSVDACERACNGTWEP